MLVLFYRHVGHKTIPSLGAAPFRKCVKLPDDSTYASLCSALLDWVSKLPEWSDPHVPIQYGYFIEEAGTEPIAQYLACERS